MKMTSNQKFTANGFEYSYELVYQSHAWERSQERGIRWSSVHKAIRKFIDFLMDVADRESGLDVAIHGEDATVVVIPSWNSDGDLAVTVKTVMAGIKPVHDCLVAA